MTDVRLSSSTKALLAAAKSDAPSAAARAKVWSGVSSAVGGVAGAAGAAGASGTTVGAAAGFGTAKLLAVGALLGGTVTVGLAVTFLRMAPASMAPPPAILAPSPAARVIPSADSRHDGPPVPSPDLAASPLTARPLALASSLSSPSRSSSFSLHPAAHGPSPKALAPTPGPLEDPLAREASLVSAARLALGRGDPAAALRSIRAARALPSHQLVPEELAVEAQALRALGHAEEAKNLDETLRSRYPESALSR